MEAILWKSCYCVGHCLIDRQHQELVHLVNFMIQKVSEQCPKPVIDAILIKLINYAERHFTDEEEVMRTINYPELEAHQKEHERLVMEVFNFKDAFDKGKVTKFDLLEFLKDWLLDHVINEDLRLKKYFL
ncbi:bacteriohemerythrin [Thermodesulfatator indicus]